MKGNLNFSREIFYCLYILVKLKGASELNPKKKNYTIINVWVISQTKLLPPYQDISYLHKL
jgi:hypothetical protein